MVLSDIIFGSKEIKIYETDSRVSIAGEFINGDFWYPRGAANGEGVYYISDSYHGVIKVFNEENMCLGEFGKGLLAEPSGLLYYERKVYVCDTDNGKIRVFDKDGKYISDFGPKFKRPNAIEIMNCIFYVNDMNGHGVYGLDEEGNITIQIENGLKYPAGIAVSQNYIYVASQFSKEIRKYSISGLYIGNIAEGGYFSKVRINGEKLYILNEETGSLIDIEVNEEPFDEDKFFENSEITAEIAYYMLKKDKKRALKYFEDINLWDKKRTAENRDIAEILDKKEYYKFMAQYSPDKNYYAEKLGMDQYFIEQEREIKKVSNDTLEKPKALFIDGDDIWVSLFNKKIVAKISAENEILGYYTSEIQTDKIIHFNEITYQLDYFYRKIYKINENEKKMEIFSEYLTESPIDMKKYQDHIEVLDSVDKSIIKYRLNGSVAGKIEIEGSEPVSFCKNEKYYVLDKRSGNVYIYTIDGKKEKEIVNKFGLKYPEGIAVDDKGYIYITDEGNNRIVKIDNNGEFVFELGGFSMPKDIVYETGRIYVSNYAADNIKIYKVR